MTFGADAGVGMTHYVANVCTPLSTAAVSGCNGGRHPPNPVVVQINTRMQCFVLGTVSDSLTGASVLSGGSGGSSSGLGQWDEEPTSSPGRWSLADPAQPRAGVKVEYTGGDMCLGTPGKPRRRITMVFQVRDGK